jgi:hypothetical protein
MRDGQTLAISDVNLVRTMIFISTDGEVGQIMSEMMCGTSLGIPAYIRWSRRSSLINRGKGRFNLIGMVKSMVTLSSCVTRFETDLASRSKRGRVIEGATITTPTPASTTMVGERRDSLLS